MDSRINVLESELAVLKIKNSHLEAQNYELEKNMVAIYSYLKFMQFVHDLEKVSIKNFFKTSASHIEDFF